MDRRTTALSSPPHLHRSPEELLATFLEAHPDPSSEEIEALCAEHAVHGAHLRGLLAAHRAVGGAFPSTLAGDGPGLHRPSRSSSAPTASGFRVSEGMTLGDFTLVRILGRGGMGEVWEADQLSLSRRVALKLLLPERVDQRGLEFFAREARAGGRLAHPCIVSVFGTGEDEGLHWIAMELVEEACDLRQTLESLREEGDLPRGHYEQVAEFVARVADALEVAHAGGVIHRDVKPSNILVTSDDRPKVSDFGLARLTDEHSISLAGDLVGTYAYMSPEQVAARRAGIDHRTDVFSLGVVLYEMLTLVRAFDGDTTEQVAKKILWEDPVDPRTLRSKVPRDLAVICVKAIRKDPGRRYGTMAELAADLRRHLADEPILARPPGPIERAAKWVRRNPTRFAVAGVAAAALVVISWLGLIAMENARQEAQRAEELEQLSEFVAGQLSGVDAAAMGLTIRDMVIEAARDVSERTGRGPQVLDDERAALEKLLAGADFTGLARGVLYKEVFEKALQELEDFANQPLVQAQLFETVAIALRELGLLERALEPQQQAVEIRRRELGEEHSETLISIDKLGVLLMQLGKLDQAEPLLRETLEAQRRTLGDEHSETLESIGDLAVLLKSQANLDGAERLYRESLEGRRRTLGNEHPRTLVAINNLGLLLEAQGKVEEAEPLVREALETQRRTLGDEHPETMNSINSLGGILMAQTKFAASELLFREALEARRRTLGNEHPDTLLSINNLAGLLHKVQGRLDDAEQLVREALKAQRRTLGNGHPHTLISINNLGMLLEHRGMYEEAEPLLREALEGSRRTLGDEHSGTLSSIRNLGALLKAQGKLPEAEPLLREALEVCRHTLSDGHLDTLSSLDSLGGLLTARGKFGEAEPLLREALEVRRRTLGNEHQNTLRSIHSLGGLLGHRGKLPETELLFREALGGRRRTLGDEHTETLISIDGLGVLLLAQDKLDEAEPFLREALEGFRRKLGDEHPNTLTSLNNLGNLHRAQGKLDEAEPLLREAMEVRRRTLGDDHLNTLISIGSLGFVLQGQRTFDEAEPLLREALEGFRRTLGDEHPHTLTSLNNLSDLHRAQGKLDQAEPLVREAMEVRRRTLGDDHPSTLISIGTLGFVLQAQGMPDEAEPLLREALDGFRRTLGDEDPKTLKTKRILEDLLAAQRESKTPPDEVEDGDDQ